jgi:hypothetical protein
MAAQEELYASKVQALRAAIDEGEASDLVDDFSFEQLNEELDAAGPRRPAV